MTGGVPTMMLGALLALPGGYRTLSRLLTADGLEMLSRSPRNLGFLRSIMRSDADIVASWNWHWPLAYYAYLARRLKRLRLVGIPLFHTAEHWAQRPVYDQMIGECAALVANTAHEKDFILSRAPTAERIVVAGVGIDPEMFARRDGQDFRTRHAIGAGPLVGFVGQLIGNKGVDKVAEAMPIVWEWNKDVRCVLAGMRSDEFPRLDEILRDLGPDARKRILILPNFAEGEKASLYDALDVFVLPSTGESFGIAYLEAWMCRKAVVGSRIGSTACVIEEDSDGLLVEPNDPRDIARAIVALLGDPGRRARMGERGHAKTLAQFTWEKVTDRVERLYLDVIAKTPIHGAVRWSRRRNLAEHAVASSRGIGPDGNVGRRSCKVRR
jgi:glycosyltransferase involved in cell wall biosynthesis